MEAAAFSLFFKPMLDDFGWDRATLSAVESLSLVAVTLVCLFTGRLIDKIGASLIKSKSQLKLQCTSLHRETPANLRVEGRYRKVYNR